MMFDPAQLSTLLTEAQLNQIATVFGLKKKEYFPVLDGYVTLDDKVWWRCETGPEHVEVHRHIHNLKEFPRAYQLSKPKTKIVYLEEGL
jgi:hypothetical protein